MLLELGGYCGTAKAIDLRVISVQVWTHVVMPNQPQKVRRVQQEKYRSEDQSLRYSAQDDYDVRNGHAAANVLGAAAEVRREPPQCAASDAIGRLQPLYQRYRGVLCACFELWGVTVYTLHGRGSYMCRGEYERWAAFVMFNLVECGMNME